jgi:hypothetical protein
MTTRIPSTLNASLGPSEILTILLSMSANVTHDTLLTSVENLPRGAATEKLGVISVSACMSVKKVVSQVTAAVGLNLPDEWMVNGSPNMSMFAMCGHLIFMLPDRMLTSHGVRAKAVYQKSLGGARDLRDFGTAGSIPAKPERTKILREWSSRLEGADLKRAGRVLSAKFPTLVKSGPFASALNMIPAPIAYVLGLPFRLLSFAASLVTGNAPPIVAALLLASLFDLRARTPIIVAGRVVTGIASPVVMTLVVRLDEYTSSYNNVKSYAGRIAYQLAVDYGLVSTSGRAVDWFLSDETLDMSGIIDRITSLLPEEARAVIEEAGAGISGGLEDLKKSIEEEGEARAASGGDTKDEIGDFMDSLN